MGEDNMKHVKCEPESDDFLVQYEELQTPNSAPAPPGWEFKHGAQESEDNRSSNALSNGQSSTSILEQAQSPVEYTSFSAPNLSPAPLCRQFWKAGNYDDLLASKSRLQNSQNYLHVHPKFLHSNATSHKWAFGAIAELLDNAIDEIQNGATFVIVDKISNPRDGSPALLIQDDGGGMDPEAIRRCMSFGFSDKKSTSAIGRYGNGFKTSTMRLGADVIVFSRHTDNRTLTQSIGLLSYTYLSRSGLDRIVVPMVDYEHNISTASFEPLHRYGKEHFKSNISTILQWSPYSTEKELIKQFDDIGAHGTKVIVYNLWFTDDGTLEFDFESDHEDIRLHGSNNSGKTNSKMLISEQHIANRYHYSLRVYLSILYLRIPQNFVMILRGKVVRHHSIAHDLKFPEFILYKPQTGGTKEGEVLTTIGFLKEAPHVYIHGFNVYHKNRLIKPFWHVVNYSDSRGRGVVGILEANFVEPTHNKQDFERTSLFQKLETRLKEMTWEYWDYHCGLIGYQVKKKNPAPAPLPSPHLSSGGPNKARQGPVSMNKSSNLGPAGVISPARPVVQNLQSSTHKHGIKRAHEVDVSALGRGRRQPREGPDAPGRSMEIQLAPYAAKPLNQQEACVLIQENEKLRAKCLGHKKAEEELNQKLSRLKRVLEEEQQEYQRMLNEVQLLGAVKGEKDVV